MTTDPPKPMEVQAPATIAGSPAPPKSSMPRDQALDVSRMVAACIILLHHGALFYTTAGGPPWLGRDAWAVTNQLTLWSRVPFFFFLAGYFASYSLGKPGAKGAPYVKKRFATLLPPYLFWNILSASLIFIAVAAGMQVSANAGIDPLSTLMRITGFGRPPADGSLWFVRDLLLCACVAPLFHRFGVWILIPCITLTIIPEDMGNNSFPRPSSFGFFGIGMLLYLVPRGTLSKLCPRPGLGALMVLAVSVTFVVWNLPYPSLGGVAVGTLGIYMFSRWLVLSFPRLSDWLSENAGASFIIFAGNAPFYAVMEQAYGKLFSDIPILAYFIGCGLVFCVAAILSYLAMKRWLPVLLPIVSGGR